MKTLKVDYWANLTSKKSTIKVLAQLVRPINLMELLKDSQIASKTESLKRDYLDVSEFNKKSNDFCVYYIFFHPFIYLWFYNKNFIY